MPDKRLIDANALADKIILDWGLTHQNQLISATTKLATADAMCKLLGEVAKCQTIDAVEVVHGRWVFDRPNHYKCSLCDAMWSGVVRFMKFCPDCGMPMDGGAEC